MFKLQTKFGLSVVLIKTCYITVIVKQFGKKTWQNIKTENDNLQTIINPVPY